MFELIKKIFISLLTGIVSASNQTKCVLLSNQKFMIQPTLINLHPNEYSQEFHSYTFAVKLDTCVGSCNNQNDLSNKAAFQIKQKIKSKHFNMTLGINELKTLKHIMQM